MKKCIKCNEAKQSRSMARHKSGQMKDICKPCEAAEIETRKQKKTERQKKAAAVALFGAALPRCLYCKTEIELKDKDGAYHLSKGCRSKRNNQVDKSQGL